MAGKAGRSGRKSKGVEQSLQDMLDIAWPKASRIKCFQKLAEMAEQGDKEAIKLLAAYTFGKPPETITTHGDMTVKVVYGKGAAK